MKTAFVYLAIFTISPIVMSVSQMVLSLIVGLSLCKLPLRKRAPFSLVAGIGGVAAAFYFSCWLFERTFGLGEFQILPVITTVAGLLVPVARDSVKVKQLQASASRAPTNRTRALLQDEVDVIEWAVIGQKFTLFVGAFWLILERAKWYN